LATALTASTLQPFLAEPTDVERAITRIFGPLRTPNFDDLGPPPIESPRVGDLLVANGAATDEQVEEALREQERTGSLLGEVLLHSGAIREADLVDALTEQFRLPALDIEGGHVDADVVRTIPEAVARELRVAPVAADETRLYLAVADPLDAAALERLREYTDKEIVAFLSPLSQVDEILEATYREEYLYLATDDLRERAPENCALRVVTPRRRSS